MSIRLVAVTFDVGEPQPVAHFWAQLLDREVVHEHHGVLVPGDDRQVGLRFVGGDVAATARPWLHLHVTSETPDAQEATVARALSLGGRHLDVGQLPEEGHIVLADPGGNELCVIEFGNRFLAGCGPLGEVACEGTHDVGVFWHGVLDWPLVWDQNEETAVQAPAGGTKVAWGGGPLEVPHGRTGQRFDLVADDVAAETERLLSLGATRLGDLPGGGVELADVDGNAFHLDRA